MKRVVCVLFVGAVIGLSSPVSAEQHKGGELKTKKVVTAKAAKVVPPKPSPEMAQMKYFLGSWRCKGTLYSPMPGHAPRKYSATTRMRLELDGHWMVEHYKQRKTKANPRPQKSMFIYGYDPAKKRFQSSYLDNLGARAHMSTPGWQGDRWQEEGTMVMGGKRMKIRATFTKKGKRKFSALAELAGPKGWVKVNEGECRR